MENEVNCMRLKELKDFVASLENNPAVDSETKIFLNTGWESIQEILPGSLSLQPVEVNYVEDPLTKERFSGYHLAKEGAGEETVIVIENLY